MARANWAGNYTYGARKLHEPKSLDEAREIIRRAQRIHVLGSGHSFTSIADSSELLSLASLPSRCEIDAASGAVRVTGGVRYGQLAEALDGAGLALGNLASLPHISVAGAIQTATHGSGVGLGNLATSVTALELLCSDGETVTAVRGEPDFEGLVVGLGALGAVIAVTLEAEPTYEIRQYVYDNLGWAPFFDHFDEIMALGYSVSAFTLWGENIHQLWIKQREPQDELADVVYDARAATAHRHPIPGLDPVNCTPQLGRPGPWFDRLPHFRLGFTPSSGAEIQSEYLIPRESALPAIEAVRALGELVQPLLQVSEIRSVDPDSLWMSPQYATRTVGIHFTWRRHQRQVERALERIEAVLRPFGARPHWGKLFLAEASDLEPLYPRVHDFRALRDRLDPRGALRNPWLERHVLGR